MMYLNDLKIDIKTAISAVSQAGFGVPMILGFRATGNALIGTCNSFDNSDDLHKFLLATKGSTLTDEDLVEYNMFVNMLAQSPCPDEVIFYFAEEPGTTDVTAKIKAILAAANAANSDWYALLTTKTDQTTIAIIADWTSAQEKIFFAATAYDSAFIKKGLARTALYITAKPEKHPEAAVVGMCLPEDPGSITWKWKSPENVSADDYSTAILKDIRDNNAQTLCERSDVVYTDEGIANDGTYIDILQARDYMKARLEEDLLSLMTTNGKIPYDNTGFAQIESIIRARLTQCGAQGIIARCTTETEKKQSDEGVYMYKVSIPKRDDTSANDRAKRALNNVTFTAVLAGAVHTVAISGTITV
jgi:hypothetical protein